MEQMLSYLGSQSYDLERLKGMGVLDMVSYLQSIPPLPEQEEYSEALKILRDRKAPGTLPDYDCPVCNNKGFVLDITDDGLEYSRECSCIPKRKSIRYARESGLGELLKKRIETFVAAEPWQNQVANVTKQYIASEKDNWFCMLGQSGCGKTHLCSAIANVFLHLGRQTVYMVWNLAAKELKQHAMDADYEKLFNRYASAQVLYIDDFLKGKITETDLNLAFELLNARYNQKNLITILSSELLLTELAQKDTAIAGRIKERCGPYVIQIGRDPKKNFRFREEVVL